MSIMIQRTSPFSGESNGMQIDMSQEEFNRSFAMYSSGAMIQDAFPTLDANEREFIKTGITPAEWDEL